MNLLAVLFDFRRGWLYLWAHGATIEGIRWSPAQSLPAAHLALLRDALRGFGGYDLYLGWAFGWPAWALFGAGLLALGTLLALVIRPLSNEAR